MEAVGDLADEALIIIEESKKDDEIDADGNGKKDVQEMTGLQLLKRKSLLVLKKMNPEKIDSAVASIYKVYVPRMRFFRQLHILLGFVARHMLADYFLFFLSHYHTNPLSHIDQYTFCFLFFPRLDSVSWISVTAVLTVEFARTISMALAIADFINKPCELC
eukprot:scaffold15108_cov180-Amphora_coffeaeformis.AAC.15